MFSPLYIAYCNIVCYMAQFHEFLQDDRFTESLEYNLRSPAGTAVRVDRIKKILAAP